MKIIEGLRENSPGHLFSIGEVSKVLGISRRIILNYEACGLIRPDKREGEAGNRYYTIDTLTQIRTVRVYQSFGLSLEEIRRYFDGSAELSPLIERLETLRDELTRNIEQLRRRVRSEKPRIDLIETAPQTIFRLRFPASSIPERTALLRRTALEALRLYGMESGGRWYSIETPFPGDSPECSFCVAVPPESKGEHVETLPPQKALSLYHYGAYEGLPAAAAALQEYAESKGLRTRGLLRRVYLEGPPQHRDPSRFVTQLLLPLAAAETDSAVSDS